MLALVILIIARIDTEGNQAAPKDAAHEAKNQTEDPSQSTRLLFDLCHACVPTELAGYLDGVLGPATRGVRARLHSSHCDDLSVRLVHHSLCCVHNRCCLVHTGNRLARHGLALHLSILHHHDLLAGRGLELTRHRLLRVHHTWLGWLLHVRISSGLSCG